MTQNTQQVFGTALCVDNDSNGRKVLYPQISHLSPLARESVYWKCAVVCLASVRKLHPNHRICLVSNRRGLPVVDGVSIQQVLNKLEIEYRFREFSDFCPPYELSKTFRNAFYKFEALDELAEPGRQVMLFDTDCVASRSLLPVFEKSIDGALGVYEVLAAGTEREVQGICCQDLSDFFERIYGRSANVSWLGGEFYCGNSAVIKELTEKLRFSLEKVVSTQSLALHKFRNAAPVLSNDEFLASVSVAACGFPVISCNALISRLWTAHDSARVSEDRRFLFWHLPAEKHLGFVRLFPEACDCQSPFWRLEGEDFVSYIGGVFAIPTREWAPDADKSAKGIVAMIKWLLRFVLPRPIWAGLRSFFIRGVWDSR